MRWLGEWELRLWQGVYPVLLQALLQLVKRKALRDKNLQDGLQGREGLWERLGAQVAKRSWGRPLVWFHVASAGEFLQALPVMERCVARGWECGLTYSSVNALRWLERMSSRLPLGVVFTEFLPADTRWNAQRLLATVQPQSLVFVSYDLWPQLIWEASRQQVPLFLISAIVHSGSFREAHPLGRSLYRTLYRQFDRMFAVSEEDAARIRRSVGGGVNLQVTGDTRCDSVLERRDRMAPLEWPEWLRERFVFVAGSIWPEDERCIASALNQSLHKHPELLVVLAPHEPTPEHLNSAEEAFQDWPQARWSEYGVKLSPETRVLVIDAVGVLAQLYQVAQAAFVGGAFTTGVHNTMEPASFGVPVVFGPRFDNALEARTMLQRNAAFSVDSLEAFAAHLRRWLENPEECRQQGQRARRVIEEQRGAAEACVPWILPESSPAYVGGTLSSGGSSRKRRATTQAVT
ncbi:MAG: 3-deoxy-D-manno-octulosonic acid transferase [bacterium]